MKKILLIVTLLFVCVATSGCVNNFAVQELNAKAKEYTQNGEYEEAIARLKSAADLAPNSFETYYNLGSVYSKTQNWADAIENYVKVITINPDFADAYYSLAVSEENLLSTMLEGELTPIDKKNIYDLMQKAVQDYQTYLDKSPDAKDRKDVEQSIDNLRQMQSDNMIDQEILRRL